MQLKMQPNSAMAKTPRFIREMLMFQYCEGSSFVQKFLQKHKSWKEIDSLFENPPLSTEQIMHPEKYLGEIDYPVRIHLPELHKRLEGGWEEITTGNMGEFLLKVFLSEFIDGKTAAAAATGWDGDSYTMIESKEKGGPQIIALLSVWDSEKDAREFAEAYAGALGKRFKTKAQKLDTGFFLHVEDEKETVLIELAGTQALVIQGAPVLLIPEVRSLVLKARQVEMKERGFDDLAGQKPDLPGPPAKGETEPDEEQEEKEPAKRDF